jgi:hypothetical protein
MKEIQIEIHELKQRKQDLEIAIDDFTLNNRSPRDDDYESMMVILKVRSTVVHQLRVLNQVLSAIISNNH